MSNIVHCPGELKHDLPSLITERLHLLPTSLSVRKHSDGSEVLVPIKPSNAGITFWLLWSVLFRLSCCAKLEVRRRVGVSWLHTTCPLPSRFVRALLQRSQSNHMACPQGQLHAATRWWSEKCGLEPSKNGRQINALYQADKEASIAAWLYFVSGCL